MKFSYDPDHNVAYIRFRPESTEVESLKISDELVVDLTPDGKIYGIELLNANEQLSDEATGRFLFSNQATGKEVEIPVSG